MRSMISMFLIGAAFGWTAARSEWGPAIFFVGGAIALISVLKEGT